MLSEYINIEEFIPLDVRLNHYKSTGCPRIPYHQCLPF